MSCGGREAQDCVMLLWMVDARTMTKDAPCQGASMTAVHGTHVLSNTCFAYSSPEPRSRRRCGKSAP